MKFGFFFFNKTFIITWFVFPMFRVVQTYFLRLWSVIVYQLKAIWSYVYEFWMKLVVTLQNLTILQHKCSQGVMIDLLMCLTYHRLNVGFQLIDFNVGSKKFTREYISLILNKVLQNHKIIIMKFVLEVLLEFFFFHFIFLKWQNLIFLIKVFWKEFYFKIMRIIQNTFLLKLLVQILGLFGWRVDLVVYTLESFLKIFLILKVNSFCINIPLHRISSMIKLSLNKRVVNFAEL